MDPPEPLTPPALEAPNTESASPDPPMDPAPEDEEPLEVPEILLTEDPEALFPEDENVLEPLVDTDEELLEEVEEDPLAFTA